MIPVVAAKRQHLLCFVVISLLCSTTYVHAYFIHVDANSEECFFEQAQRGEKLTLTFEVAEGGFLDIDVNVSSSSS